MIYNMNLGIRQESLKVVVKGIPSTHKLICMTYHLQHIYLSVLNIGLGKHRTWYKSAQGQ